MNYSFLLFSCCFVFSLYSVHEPSQSLLIRALDLPELSSSVRNFKATQYTVKTLYKRGVQWRASNQVDEALTCFATAARLGHRPACYELGILMCSKGNYSQAVYWLLQAACAEQDATQKLYTWYVPALCYLEEIYAGLHGEDLYRALVCADYQGDYYAQVFTKACTWYAEKQYAQAYGLFSMLSSYGHPLALYMLGVCYDTGNGIERDKYKAYSYYKQAAERGYNPAQQACAWRDKLYKPEEHVTQTIQQLEQLNIFDAVVSTDCVTKINQVLSKPVTQGTMEDNERYAQLLACKNVGQILQRYAQDSSYAAYWCGLMYKNKDTETADAYLKIAAQKNIVRASFMLGEYYRYTCPIQALDYYLSCALADVEETQDYERQLIRTAYERIQESADKQDNYARICLILYRIANKDDTAQYIQALQECQKLFLQACHDDTLANLIKVSPLPSTLTLYTHSDARVEYLRALLYLQVPGFVNIKQGMTSLKLAAHNGSSEARLMLSMYLRHGIDGVEKDLPQAFSLLVKAHEQGFMLATLNLACAYKEGILVPQDLEKAQELFNSPCLDNCVLALCCRVSHSLEQSVQDTTNIHKLLARLEEHAQAGDEHACLTLGLAYYEARDGWGQDKLTRAFRYLEKAAAKGYVEAYRIMGRMLYFAEGITGNKASGEELLCKARLLGDQEVIYDLADVFYNRQEYQQAFSYYQESYCKTKSADAAAGLALCYTHGHGVQQNIRQAVNYISFALKNGVNSVVGFKSLHTKRVLPVILDRVIVDVNCGKPGAQFMLELLSRALQSVGFAWKKESNIIMIYPCSNKQETAKEVI